VLEAFFAEDDLMLTNDRLSIGLEGDAADVRVIRYAAMVAGLCRAAESYEDQPNVRLSCSAEDGATTASPTSFIGSTRPVRRAARAAEIRYVSLFSSGATNGKSSQAVLESCVEMQFSSTRRCTRDSFDLSQSRPLERLLSLAKDFDSDLLLIDEGVGTRRQRARLAAAAPFPVWFMPPASAPAMRRILVPIDFTINAVIGMRTAIELASRLRPAKCFALYVEPRQSRFSSNAVDPSRRRELYDGFVSFMNAVDRGGADVELLFDGDDQFGRAVERTVREHSIDLTVLTARRRSVLASAACPSRAESALRHGVGAALVLKTTDRPIRVFQALKNRWKRSSTPTFS
jgi:nucleotide-binding universal stress UspA family protein